MIRVKASFHPSLPVLYYLGPLVSKRNWLSFDLPGKSVKGCQAITLWHCFHRLEDELLRRAD